MRILARFSFSLFKNRSRLAWKQKMPFIQKKDNPANLPETRPIKYFWSMLKRNV